MLLLVLLLSSLQLRGSGWSLQYIRRLDVALMSLPLLKGGGGESLEMLYPYTQPDYIHAGAVLPELCSRGLLDIKPSNEKLSKKWNNRCLQLATLYCIAQDRIQESVLEDKVLFLDRRSRADTYDLYEHLLNVQGCQWPGGLDTLRILERNNPLLNFTVYGPRGRLTDGTALLAAQTPTPTPPPPLTLHQHTATTPLAGQTQPYSNPPPSLTPHQHTANTNTIQSFLQVWIIV